MTEAVLVVTPAGERVILETFSFPDGGGETTRRKGSSNARKGSGGSSRKALSIARNESGYSSVGEEKFVTIVASLKKAASLFAASLNVPESHKIHIRGSSTLFSYYKLGSSGVVALYNVVGAGGGAAAEFDVESADSNVKPVLSKLEGLLIRMES